jgi:hypothetical protein
LLARFVDIPSKGFKSPKIAEIKVKTHVHRVVSSDAKKFLAKENDKQEAGENKRPQRSSQVLRDPED